MKEFVRMTRLSDIGGRADYISNPDRQEKVVTNSAPVDWEPYRRFEQANQRTAKKNNEGRELVISLLNSWAKLPEEELARRAQSIAETAIGKSTDLQWAVHWNKRRTNLHLHVVFSERQIEATMERWDRDIYHTADGKVARRKADRARLPDGSIAPPVHRKGELKDCFTAKDAKYKTREWLHETKGVLKALMEDRWQVKFDAPNLLHEYHEGKGSDAPKIRAKNEAIRATNQNVNALIEAHPEMGQGRIYAVMKQEAAQEVMQGHVVEFKRDGEDTRILAYELPTWKILQKQRQQQAEQSNQTPAEPAPEPPKAPFADLIEAQRELYRQTFALYDDRKPLNTAEIRRAADIRAAADSLASALQRREQAKKQQYDCSFLQIRAKKAAEDDYDRATRSAESELERLKSLGVDTRIGSASPDLFWHKKSDFDDLCARAKGDAAYIEHEARKNARPSDALKGSQTAQEAAHDRFIALCHKVPSERRTAARIALMEATRELEKERERDRYPRADRVAADEISRLRDRLLTAPQGDEKTQEHQQDTPSR